MRKTTAWVLLVIMTAVSFAGCGKTPRSSYTKYTDSFYDAFDTLTTVVAYTKNEEEFKAYYERIKSRFEELHRLYDKYNLYEGINNIKTINDNAGIKPVKVDREITDLLLFARNWAASTGGKFNIALGAVLEIWHQYREEGKDDPLNAKIPAMESLRKAAAHTDISKVIIDEENSTVFLEDKDMSLDVGAVAKGYATELVAKEIMAAGLVSGMISAGGNIRVLGKPLDGIRERWGISIHDPDKPVVSDEINYLDVIFVTNKSVVSSGDYERYYVVGDRVLHHLIDPETLMPGDHYRAVTVVTEDSGVADILSTAVFLLPYDESLALVKSIGGVEALWVMKDGEIRVTDGMKKIMRSNGATGAKAE